MGEGLARDHRLPVASMSTALSTGSGPCGDRALSAVVVKDIAQGIARHQRRSMAASLAMARVHIIARRALAQWTATGVTGPTALSLVVAGIGPERATTRSLSTAARIAQD